MYLNHLHHSNGMDKIQLKKLVEKQRHLVKKLKNRDIKYNYHDSKTSLMEAVIARGDRRIGKVIYDAFKNGAKFDGWAEHFKLDIWKEAMEKNEPWYSILCK